MYKRTLKKIAHFRHIAIILQYDIVSIKNFLSLFEIFETELKKQLRSNCPLPKGSGLFFCSVLATLIFEGISNVKTVASLEMMMPTDMEEIKYFNILGDNFLGKDIIGIGIDIESQNKKGMFNIKNFLFLLEIKNFSC